MLTHYVCNAFNCTYKYGKRKLMFLRKHLGVEHKQSMACPQCSLRFVMSKKQLKHFNSEHRMFCTFCFQTFTRQSHVHLHLTTSSNRIKFISKKYQTNTILPITPITPITPPTTSPKTLITSETPNDKKNAGGTHHPTQPP